MSSKALDFFDLAYENFLTGAKRTSLIRKFYRIGPFPICIQFAGETLSSFLTASLAHLETGEAPYDLLISVWDGTSTQAPNLSFPWGPDSFTVHGSVVGFNDDRIHTVFDPHLKILQMIDQKRDSALFWIENREKAPWWVGMSTFQFTFHWWMSRRGLQLTHAAAVGYREGGVIFAGKSGAGKSTTSLSCMKGGMKYVSEDYCLISGGANVQVYSVYNSAKITEKTLSFFPELGPHIENRERLNEEKAFFFHHKFQPDQILSSFPLKGVIALNRIDVRESSLEPIAPVEVMGSFAGTTLWQLANTGPSVFNHLKRVAETVPCFRLNLGSDLTQPPKLIERLLT